MVNFGIIGCGKIGIRHIGFLKNMDGIRLLAVSDVIKEKAKQTSVLCDNKAEIFTDYKELLKNPDIDIVNICTPTGLHAKMSIDALNAGKHVLCEKPMCLNVKEADRIIEAVKANNKHLFVVKQNRFNQPIKILKDALDKGMFGKLYTITSNVMWNRRPEYYKEESWRGTLELDGGALATQASHFIDTMQWIGGKVKCVFAKTDRFLHDIETEDTGAIIIKFESGAFGMMYYTNCAYNKNIEGSITILGTKGSAKIGGEYLNKIEFWNVEGYPLPEKKEESYHGNELSYRGSSSKHDQVFREVIKKIIGDENPSIVDALEGKKTVEIIEAVHLSAKTGKEVFLPLYSNLSEGKLNEPKTMLKTEDYSDYLKIVKRLADGREY